MRHLLYFLFILLPSIGFAQENAIEIKGFVHLQEAKTILEGAKITINDHLNTQHRTNALSDSAGFFSLIHRTNADSIHISISYPYCISYNRTFSAHTRTINLDTVVLLENELLFDEITVIAKRKPITVRNDTTIYDARSFMTSEDDLVEGLLEVLPGVMVDSEGKIFANGIEVDKVLVDGKPFFGGDLTIATRNLYQDLLLSVEIFNSKSTNEAFTRSEGNPQSKTINLILREDKKKGVFGQLSAGVGVQNKYEINGMLNRFSGSQQISIIGGANNVNKSQFRGGQKSIAASIPRLTGTNGVAKPRNLGFNYTSQLNDKLDLSGNYLMTHSTTIDSTASSRKTTFAESTFFTNRVSQNSAKKTNHTLNLGVNFKPKSGLLINYKPSFNYGTNEVDFDQVLQQSDEFYVPTNTQEQTSKQTSKNQGFNSRLSLTNLIGNSGGAFSFIASNQNTKTTKSTSNFSQTETTSNPLNNELRDQLINNNEAVNAYSAEMNYKVVIQPKSVFLTVGVTYNYKNTLLKQNVNELMDTSATTLALDFNRNNIDNNLQPNVEFSLNKNNWRVKLSSGYLIQSRSFEDHFTPSNNIQRQFGGLMIASNVNYEINPGTNLTASYNLRNTPPQLTQIQTFPNLFNPLNVFIGNPFLKSTENHQFQVGLNSYSSEKNRFLSFSSSFGMLNNQVIQRTEIDENFVTTSSYVNVAGGYSASTLLNYRKRMNLDSLNSLNLDVSISSSLNSNPNMNSGTTYDATSFSFTPAANIDFTRKEHLKIKAFYHFSLAQTRFSISNFTNQTNKLQTGGVSTEVTFFKQFSVFNSAAFNYNPTIADASERFNFLWNLGLSYAPPEKDFSFSVALYDVLNSNASNTRSVTSTYVENTTHLVLNRYFMCSLHWKFRKM